MFFLINNYISSIGVPLGQKVILADIKAKYD